MAAAPVAIEHDGRTTLMKARGFDSSSSPSSTSVCFARLCPNRVAAILCMTMAEYSKIPPSATLQPTPFTAHIAEEKVQLLYELVRLSPVGPVTFENAPDKDGRYGVPRDWLLDAKDEWASNFQWRAYEKRINSYPNFTAPVVGSHGEEIQVHFVALFSEREDAVPVAMYHGWPGSFMDYAHILDLLMQRYRPSELPYHVIVPSLPGYAFSGTPPAHIDYDIKSTALLFNNLMTGLGFDSYIAHGGDLGSGISREQALGCDACTGFHLSMILAPPPVNKSELELVEAEVKNLQQGMSFKQSGMAYAMEHGTRGATIGLALQSSPIALLCWIGEKMLAWADEPPTLERILENVSLYWLTEAFPRGLFPYRKLVSGNEPKLQYIDKPLGYSFFPREIFTVPVSWARTTANLVHFNRHESGGHFPAWEKPEELLEDIEAYIAQVYHRPGIRRTTLPN